MQTLDILTKINNAMIQHPEIIDDLDPEDIITKACLELCDYSSLYGKERWDRAISDLSILCDDLRNAFKTNDHVIVSRALKALSDAFLLLPDPDHALKFFEQSNYDHALADHLKNHTTIVMGDSHVNIFSGNELLSFIPIGNDINTCPVVSPFEGTFTPLHLGGALAYNSSSYGSTNRFREKVEFLIEKFIMPNSRIICSLGEIDLRVHVCSQAKKQERSSFEIIDSVITRYLEFLNFLKERGFDLYVFGPIASQKDDCPIDPEYPHTGSEKERNISTEYFNNSLRDACQNNGIGFFTIFDKMIDSDYLTLGKYISSDGVHLGQASVPILMEAFQSATEQKHI